MMKMKLNSITAAVCLSLCLLSAPGGFTAFASEGEALQSQGQYRTLKGTVKDSSGQPVVGAGVLVKGTSVGSVTGLDGSFTLSAPEGAVIEVSCIGYKTVTVTADMSPLDIILSEDYEALEETVVIGYGTQKKVNLTGSVGVATSEDIQSRPVTSATQALQGVVPGLVISTNTGQLDQNYSIKVRGTGTIGSGTNSSPLVLIDGMEGDLNTINPQDIESISVLKDASSASIYGSRAAFGVILVTTKKGDEGKSTFNYNNSLRISSPINLPQQMDSYSWAVMMNEAARNQGVNNYYSAETMQKMLDFQAGKLTGTNGLDVSPTNPNSWDDRWFKGYANTDIWSELFKKNVFSQEHNLSLTGGTKAMSYYASFNYLNQNGELNYGDDGFNRYNATIKISSQINRWLKFNASARFMRRDDWRPTRLTSSFYETLGSGNWPNMPVCDANGNTNHDAIRQLTDGGERNARTDRHYYQASVVLEPIKHWVTTLEYNFSKYDGSVKEGYLTYYNYNPQGEEINNGSQSTSIRETSQKQNYNSVNAYSSYENTFGGKHYFKAMAGFQMENYFQHYFDVTKYGLLTEDPDFLEINMTNGLGGKGQELTTATSGYSNEWATAGFFGRINYDYQGKYLFESNVRYDGTSRFRRGSRWQLSPSFSAGWNISKEDFFQPIKQTVSYLKLRASYGVLGNQNTSSYYPTYRTMSLSSSSGSWLQAGAKTNTASVGSLISTSLTWETVKTWNVGVDYGFFNNRLSGSFDYFTRYTENMVGPADQLPNTLGISVPNTNNCDLHTTGWELSISWKDHLSNGFSYGATFNLSDQTTIIDSYPGNKTGSIDSYMEGKETGLIWGYTTIGIAKTQEEMDAHLASLPNGGQTAVGSQWSAGDIMYYDVNGDGKINEGARTWEDHGDLTVIGHSNPHYHFGLDLTASWKGFDLRCFLQGVMKHDFWPGSSAMFWGVKGGYSLWHAVGLVQHTDYFRAEAIGLDGHEIEANLDSYYPRPIFSPNSNGTTYGIKNQKCQTRYLQDASYMRLKNLQIGYTLPKKWMNRIDVESCRLFVSGENLLTLTRLAKMYDPETCTYTPSSNQSGKVYPLSSTWSFGVSLTL